VFAVNTMGPMRVSEAFVEHVARSDRKLIVTLTSGMGSIADNTSGGSILYRSSKAAVTWSRAVWRSISHPAASLAWVQTDMGGPNATLQPSKSIGALRQLIATFGPEQSGKFFNHTGREYPR
jgi:NAD(P)-dependent dehydrogenase (short-subunit alcohol dehydrogenase family)